ncbi:hypothetical protein D3C77_461710 [compost metagenome]
MFYEQNPEHFEVEILRYATKQTYDSRMWQTIEYKASGIEQFRKGDSLQREIEDVASEAANAAEMKAAATGNPLIFLQVKLSADLKKIEAVYSNYKRNLHSIENRLDWLTNADVRADRTVLRCDKEIALRDANTTPEFAFRIKDKTYGEKDRDQALSQIMYSMKKAIESRGQNLADSPGVIKVGNYRGFEVEVYARRDMLHFSLAGTDSYEPENLRYTVDDKFSLAGFTSRVDNFLAKFEGWRHEAEEYRGKEKLEHARALVEKDKPFPQQAKLEMLRQDVRDVMTELKLIQADDNHVSTWKPLSYADEAKQTQEKTRLRM